MEGWMERPIVRSLPHRYRDLTFMSLDCRSPFSAPPCPHEATMALSTHSPLGPAHGSRGHAAPHAGAKDT